MFFVTQKNKTNDNKYDNNYLKTYFIQSHKDIDLKLYIFEQKITPEFPHKISPVSPKPETGLIL